VGSYFQSTADAREVGAPLTRRGQKNDFRDAEAIAEAVQRPTMKFVATKTSEQLDLQALHRVRQRLVRQRTGIINQIRAFILERGVVVRQGLRFLGAELPRLLATPPDVLSPRMVGVIEGLAEDWRRLDERIERLSGEITALARQDAGCERLVSVPGIGPIISSAMVAAIGTGEAFSKGRDFPAGPRAKADCRLAIAQSSARYLSGATATCAFCSCKQRGSC
jgi:transposase